LKEQEVQMMLNRINLLEAEDTKIQRKISQTKRKAEEIVSTKQVNEQRARERLIVSKELTLILEAKREKS